METKCHFKNRKDAKKRRVVQMYGRESDGNAYIRKRQGRAGEKREWRRGGRLMALLATFCVSVLFLSGCATTSREEIKLRDLDFTVLGEEKIPEELKAKIEEVKQAPFQFTYQDGEDLYICVGYGQQETGGYSIAVEELYLTDTAIMVDTSLLGPDISEKSNKVPSYPYIVLKTQFLDQPVLFALTVDSVFLYNIRQS
jgi:hypothetical protein